MDPPDGGPAVALHGANHPSLSLRLVTPDGDKLEAGVDFNLHAWPPVPCAKYFDDRAWSAVESSFLELFFHKTRRWRPPRRPRSCGGRLSNRTRG